MAFSHIEFENLKNKYGLYSSWAIWGYNKESAKENLIGCIDENLERLNSTHVLIGLNMSKKIGIWENFRVGKHDRKLKYALNDSPLKGAYMTDLFKVDENKLNDKIINPDSLNFHGLIKKNPKIIDVNVELFKEEMNDIKISSETKFIIFGYLAGKLYRDHFADYFPRITPIFHRHYSSRGTDREWVTNFWKALEIHDNFEKILESYN